MSIDKLQEKFKDVVESKGFSVDPRPKIVQITSCAAYSPNSSSILTRVYALTEDNRVWQLAPGKGGWEELPEIGYDIKPHHT
jgi:hypothetical protein